MHRPAHERRCALPLPAATGCLLPALWLVLVGLSDAWAQRLVLADEAPPTGVYATLGLGIVDVAEGTGLDIPIGITAVAPARRVMATVTAFDLGLLQGNSGDLRYRRYYSSLYQQEFCVDTTTGQAVPFGRCAGSTDLLHTAAVEVSVLPVETLYVGDKAGSLHVGLGLRLADPRTAYGSIGMFFPSHSGRAVGARLSMGREYIFLGFTWGLSLGRIGGYF